MFGVSGVRGVTGLSGVKGVSGVSLVTGVSGVSGVTGVTSVSGTGEWTSPGWARVTSGMVIYPIVLHSSCITKYSYLTKTQLALQSHQNELYCIMHVEVSVGNETFKDRSQLTSQNYCFPYLLKYKGWMYSSLPDATWPSILLIISCYFIFASAIWP